MQTISRSELKNKLSNKSKNVHLIEVLPTESFQDYHLPGAVNIPLRSANFAAEVQDEVPNKNDEIVVYCGNKQCDASPTAAKKIEELGYKNVYDYEDGKEDWKSAGLPVE